MSLHFKRKLWILMVLVLIVNRAMGQDDGQAESEEEDDDSSSEETVEDSNESGNQRRRRSPDLSDFESKSVETIPQPNFAIPGLPDPSTFIKLAEMVSRLGQEVLPQVLEAFC
ncbi:os-C isoform X2 [Haematobia irritans]|uniref:os-C isoform X2 n=1 Tax=Haematobia irritans TaxID=7368 RepID=UPI003F5048FE